MYFNTTATPTNDIDYSCHIKGCRSWGPYHATSHQQLLVALGVDTQTLTHTHNYVVDEINL